MKYPLKNFNMWLTGGFKVTARSDAQEYRISTLNVVQFLSDTLTKYQKNAGNLLKDTLLLRRYIYVRTVYTP